MSLHEDITGVFREEIAAVAGAIPLSPTTLALAVQKRFSAESIEPHLQYASLEHLKQIARKELARRYEPEGDQNVSLQRDMFSGKLQDAYPVPTPSGEDSIYKPREEMTDAELDWNIAKFERLQDAFRQHAQALRAYKDERRARLIRQSRRRRPVAA